jgi:hypothetical protein
MHVLSKNIKGIKAECPKCKTWNWINLNKAFVEPPSLEPKVRSFIVMYQPTKETKCTRCGYMLGKPDELIQITNQTQAIRYKIKDVSV